MRRPTLLCALLIAGCSAALQPSLDQVPAVGVAQEPMRRLRGEQLDLFYPATQAAAARAAAARIDGCMAQLRRLVVDPSPPPRTTVIWHGAEQNNAYVASASSGMPQQMVLPTHASLEMFNLLNLGLVEMPQVGCHEAVHYTVFGQTHGFWRALNTVFGDLLQPNVFFDLWFHEGLATYYEARLSGSFGRPDSLLWRGLFAAGVAGRGAELPAGELSELARDVGTYGGHYLVGMHFVEYLAQRFGEAKLWEVVDRQGRSIFAPFGITLRFSEVYGAPLEALFADFRADLAARYPARPAPPVQEALVDRVGLNARLASCPARGLVAVAQQDLDLSPRLSVMDAHGAPLWSRRIIDVLPGRRHAQGSVSYVSGLSFTGDCSALFVVTSDLRPDTQAGASLWELDGADGHWRRHWPDTPGIGGGVAPTGDAYAYVRVRGTAAQLAVRGLGDGGGDGDRFVETVPGATSLGGPMFSPDGATLALAGRTPRGYNLFLRHADGRYQQLTDDAAYNYAPHWLDAGHLLFMRGRDGRVQGHVLRLADRAIWPTTDAPHAALDVSPLADGVAFLSAAGWGWQAARAPLAPGPVGGPAAGAAALAPAQAQAAVALAPAQAGDATGSVPPPPAAAVAAAAHPATFVDSPYSGADGLWLPLLRMPLLTVASELPASYSVGLQLLGGDRLGLHRYSLQGSYASDTGAGSYAAAYLNSQLAPWTLSAQAAQSASVAGQVLELAGIGQATVATVATTRAVALGASRPIYSHGVAVGLSALDVSFAPRTLPLDAEHTLRLQRGRLRLLGPSAAFTYSAGEATPYAGTRLGLGAIAQASYYPPLLDATAQILDTRVGLAATLPLPLSPRHTLRLTARGRALWQAPHGSLYVGGPTGNDLLSFGLPHARRGDVLHGGPTTEYFHDRLGLSEAMRGYEDVIWQVDRVAIAEAAYRYPVIIDRGLLSLAYVLPSVFVQQLDLTGFAGAARGNGLHHLKGIEVVGAAAQLSGQIGQLGVSLGYQAAYRFEVRRLALRHLITLDLG